MIFSEKNCNPSLHENLDIVTAYRMVPTLHLREHPPFFP